MFGDLQMEKSGGTRSNGHKTATKSSTRYSESHREIVSGIPCRGQFKTYFSESLGRVGKKNTVSSKKKRAQRSCRSRERVLSSGSQEKPRENLSSSVDEHKRRNRGKKEKTVQEDDEYRKIRRKLRYLVNRINYEQSLIDAYSSEGWKGLSMEKLRPEKELERATQEILRCKLRIRDLFHQLDTLSTEGRLPDALFDAEGEIDSEDIFCAKCGSKDLSLDNDIILCDGACERGFHQYCLQPPLRREDIPPDDEGWLCPGCDCKVDCVDLLNDLLGTKLLINDAWEKVFPEAAGSGDQNLNLGLPSDDSDDGDYDPDGLNDGGNDNGDDDDDEDDHSDGNQEVQSDESSDESEFTSASDEMVGTSNGVQDINHSSDESDDDDYNPDAPTHNDDDDGDDEKQKSSGSDFSSDSEDLGLLLKGNGSCKADEITAPGESSSKLAHLHGRKEKSVTVSESDSCNDGSRGVPQRKSVKALDYKRLYDEAYGHVPSSSSDDEDWDKTVDIEEAYEPGDEMSNRNEGGSKTLKEPSRKHRRTTERTEKDKGLIAAPDFNGSHGEGCASSSYRELQTQILLEAFEENRYPEAATKENLARETQLTVKQVDKWFENRRSSSKRTLAKRVSKKGVKNINTNKKEQSETSLNGCSSPHATEAELVSDNKKAAGSRKRTRS